MQKKILVLGAGMVGKAIIFDLAKKHLVTAVDIDNSALDFCKLSYGVDVKQADLSDAKLIASLTHGFDLVISAVPGFLGFLTLEAIINAGVSVVDISFMPENPDSLDALARKRGVTAVCDCGTAPGMPNLFLGYHNNTMKINRFEYMVGGLPKERKFPFEYIAPFSPIDVIAEYMRPARQKFNGQLVTLPALSEPEMVYFKGLGHLEAFNTDGLRSLLSNFEHIPFMKEKTLRYQGHIQLIKVLKESGFFSEEPMLFDGQEINPLDFTSKILFKNWKHKPHDDEFTILRIIIEGKQEGLNKRLVYDMYDEYDAETEMSSIGRTTGYFATATANAVINGLYNKKGVSYPEMLGADDASFKYIMDYLANRNIEYESRIERY